MSLIKTIWGLLFRLFPCPTQVGLRRIGDPKRDSPVLVTCNFDLTVKRLTRILDRYGMDAWLLVADSKGVNVWCAAGGDEFDTRSVVSAVKTSKVAEEVDHRVLILPPLGGPGICAADVKKETGWSTRWGPVRAKDLPQYLSNGNKREEAMKRVTYNWKERLDTALGSLFPIYLLGALGFLILGRSLLVDYLIAGAVVFFFLFLSCPWLPGSSGLTKILVPEAILLGLLIAGEAMSGQSGFGFRAGLIIAMVLLAIFSVELGGTASTMRSDFDPFLARLGIGAAGNLAWAGKVRTELLNGYRDLTCFRELCDGCRRCYEICPIGVWEMDGDRRAVATRLESCTACRACLTQCPTGAIQAVPREA